MNAKNEIIRDLNEQIEGYQEECKNLRQEIYDTQLDLEIKSLEILRLNDVNELQHGSWMLCDSSHRDEVVKLEKQISHLRSEVIRIDATNMKRFGESLDRDKWSPFQRLIAKLFRL